ncbi:hypothetical protein L3081_22215 [Colwellia sp. MSW7]|uniref:Uncharacterized protein n=1 Tax=Colwellia maritima TaxID=2912588 RepID=A0ABS9X5V1_9GAMM|nr:hypothetical protein [Colwellia maritima]MCI2285601.1 hypothetical protein [Colwellia maritima]
MMASAWFLDIYVVIIFLMVCQTGVGMLRGFIERIDSWYNAKKGTSLPFVGQAATAGTAVLASLFLAEIGLVDLILKGYVLFAWAYFLIYLLPLLIIGSRKIFLKNKSTIQKL